MYTFGLFLLGFLILVGYKFYYGFVINWKKEKKASMSQRLFMETVLPAIFLFVGTYFIASLAIRPYMMQNPEILEDTFKALESKKKSNQEKGVLSYVEDNKETFEKYAPVIGNVKGDVTIYEFYDYSCGHCRRVATTIEELIKNDKNVKVVLKQYPISPFTFTAARAVIAAKKQGDVKVAAFHHVMMQEGVIPENLSKDMPREKIESAFEKRTMDLAKKAGLDVAKLKTDMEDPTVMEELRTTREAGTEFGIEGTPFFIIGKEVFPGALSLADFEKAVKKARK
ncbi:MAG: DsbA family protein [Alphaproteobacteria bacterium]|nr:DsbA family protein [Alphaproteobacteria bacterium]MBN2779900.1 DsbA family protein [Alphaproteobacteria bacterium]